MGNKTKVQYNARGSIVTLQLPDAFDAATLDETDYEVILHQSSGLKPGTKVMLAQLFKRGAIVRCRLSNLHRADLHLNPRSIETDDELTASGKLDQFTKIFAEITGHTVTADWSEGSDASGGRHSDPGSKLASIAEAVGDILSRPASAFDLALFEIFD